jgi:hypothetical protein
MEIARACAQYRTVAALNAIHTLAFCGKIVQTVSLKFVLEIDQIVVM